MYVCTWMYRRSRLPQLLIAAAGGEISWSETSLGDGVMCAEVVSAGLAFSLEMRD